MTVFRIHIRPQGGLANAKFSFNYCLQEGLLGVGWQSKSQNNNASWEEYEKDAFEVYGKKLAGVKYLKNNIHINDLIWTRDTKGNYYLARVESEWEYFSSKEAQDADIVNIVRCQIIKVPSVDDVPGKIVACFRPARTVQAIRDKTANQYSKFLWNKLVGKEQYPLPVGEFENVFSFLSSEEAEDVIFIYLQEKGWIVIPNSRKADTMSYEFYLVNRKTKERAIVQVKTGHTPLSPKKWEHWKEKVFLFQANNNYTGISGDNVECISPNDIESFMHENKEIMPSSILHCLDIIKNGI